MPHPSILLVDVALKTIRHVPHQPQNVGASLRLVGCPQVALLCHRHLPNGLHFREIREIPGPRGTS